MTLWALSIAGSDPSGGAGLQADLKAFFARGVQGAAVPTLITVQSLAGVRSVQPLDPSLVTAQLGAVLQDTTVHAVKTGALHNAPMVRAVAKALNARVEIPYVLDPIIMSGSGHRLLDDHGVWAMTELLLPRCTLVTPNADEASVLTRRPVRTEEEAREAAVAIQALGARAVLIKGGHLEGGDAVDVLFDGAQFHSFTAPRLKLPRLHGTGCLLSAVITAELARGETVWASVFTAKKLMNRAIENAEITSHGVALPDVFSLRD
jgi:hydroxymethylpyrimidine/phosphomethylpyrimidine kinase